MSWTDERVALLKKLHGEAHSYSYIAKQLGGVTRNGVCGKIHRLGLAMPQAPAAPRAVRPAAASPAQRPSKQPMPKGSGFVLPTLTGGDKASANRVENIAARENPAENVVLMSRSFTPIPGCKPVAFGSGGCRWPVNGEGADMLQCGADRVEPTTACPNPPYCPAHDRAAHQKPKAGAPKNGNELMRALRRWAA